MPNKIIMTISGDPKSKPRTVGHALKLCLNNVMSGRTTRLLLVGEAAGLAFKDSCDDRVAELVGKAAKVTAFGIPPGSQAEGVEVAEPHQMIDIIGAKRGWLHLQF